MTLEVTFEDCGSYLIAKVCGPWEIDEIDRQIEAIRYEAQLRGHSQILVDAYGIGPAQSGLHKYDVGKCIARRWSGSIKAAFLRQLEYGDGLVENTAVNRGANIAIFAEADQALHWLLCGKAPAPP